MTVKPAHIALILCGASVFSATGCGSDTAGNDAQSSLLRQTLAELKSPFTSSRTAAPSSGDTDISAVVEEAMRLNAGPLMLVTRDGQAPTILGQIGENGASRTYATPGMQSITLRDGVVVATRGMGDDVISAEVGSIVSALSKGATTANVPRTIRFLDGLGSERPLPLTCDIGPSKADSNSLTHDSRWLGTLVVEHCTGQGFDLTNSYLVTTDGAVMSSRQWISPQIGYITLQTLRK